MNADRFEAQTMNLREVATSVLAQNYLAAEQKKAALTGASMHSSILVLHGKFARELYRRAVESGELCVQVDSRTYLIEPKAYNEVELLEIPGRERTD